jgi:hypothetical protein
MSQPRSSYYYPIPTRELPPKPPGRCHRWIERNRNWCGNPPIGEWQVGPLCAEHAPSSAPRSADSAYTSATRQETP